MDVGHGVNECALPELLQVATRQSNKLSILGNVRFPALPPTCTRPASMVSGPEPPFVQYSSNGGSQRGVRNTRSGAAHRTKDLHPRCVGNGAKSMCFTA
jgi:hypothetical protein